MYSAFQSNAFQNNAFQIVRSQAPAPEVVLLGGGPGYERHDSFHAFQFRQEELRRQSIAEKQFELKKIDDELAEAEGKRLEAIAKSQAKLMAKNAAKRLAALEASLQQEINRLRMERVWLMRRIDDEECMLVLLMRRRRQFI